MKITLSFVLGVVIGSGALGLTGTASQVRDRGQQLKSADIAPPGPENNYYFSEPSPSGNWLFRTADFDIHQAEDPSIPVTIVGIRMYTGQREWRKHLMIESLVLKNRIAQPVASLRLGWIIMTAADHQAGKNREAALLEGRTEPIKPGLMTLNGRTNPFYFDVLKAARPLITNGELNGTFAIRVRLVELQFQNGTAWTENP